MKHTIAKYRIALKANKKYHRGYTCSICPESIGLNPVLTPTFEPHSSYTYPPSVWRASTSMWILRRIGPPFAGRVSKFWKDSREMLFKWNTLKVMSTTEKLIRVIRFLRLSNLCFTIKNSLLWNFVITNKECQTPSKQIELIAFIGNPTLNIKKNKQLENHENGKRKSRNFTCIHGPVMIVIKNYKFLCWFWS